MTTDLKTALKDKNMVFGSNETLKNLKQGKTQVVFLASNCPKDVREKVAHYSSFVKVEIVELGIKDDEVGLLCKKRHNISVLSF
ncbi:ribosomal L7Ae/L30e/S12e/Gadd45 family protein [Candidatus Woesearchaeota archaeon]|nr:ribosomal L7Ae/L30e/S12e/Gadd45 family protein [Candidatus Woesearchaeota archaeon]